MLCYLPNENNLYLFIPNSETDFIHNIQYFIHWRNYLGKEDRPPRNPNGGLISTPSLPCVVRLTRACELRGVCKFWGWHGGMVRLWVPSLSFPWNALKITCGVYELRVQELVVWGGCLAPRSMLLDVQRQIHTCVAHGFILCDSVHM